MGCLSFLYLLNVKNLILLFSCLHFVLIIVSSSSKLQLSRDDESSALIQFKRRFLYDQYVYDDPSAYPKTDSWKPEESSNCCSWDGVECDNATGHVIGLDLSSSFLFGSINSSSSLFRLVRLQKLNLADNHFNHSQIPSGIQQLSRLTYLNLSRSVFDGQIPSEISELSKLGSLDLSDNWLKLEKPSLNSLLQNLTNLKELVLSQVNISSTVPEILVNFSSLKTLYLRECELQGEFPTSIFQLPNLQSLSVRSNPYLTGHLPEFNKSSPLILLKVGGTSFYGELPDSIGNLHFLNSLDISNCNFSGSVPSSLGNLTQLEFLYLSNNSFSSGNLHWLGKQTKLIDLNLDEINLNGFIPSCFQNLTHLSLLGLESNHLTGQIPSWLGNLTQLTALGLSENKFHGSIPQSFSNLVNLEELYINKNDLSGTVELDMFLSLQYLTEIDLSSNRLSLLSRSSVNATSPRFEFVGFSSCNLTQFPDFLRYQHKLQVLHLSSNKIQGPVPKWLFDIGKDTLTFLSLENNSLTGSFGQPSVVLPWTRLKLLVLAFNKLQGSLPIPQPSINDFDVTNNLMKGEISPLICNLSSLSLLDLSNNNLSGIIPQCLGYFSSSLSILNLRNNRFHGAIPQSYTVRSNLRMIELSHNQLRGPIPRSLANCKMLEILALGNNQVDDVFPSWMGALQKLKILLLRSNKLHSVIGRPKANFDFPNLRIIDLSYNSFTGKLPYEYIQNWHAMKNVNEEEFEYLAADASFSTSEWTTSDSYDYSMIVTYKGQQLDYEKIPNIFTAIDLSSNRFEGSIPGSTGQLRQLQLLNLSNNILMGCIPSCLRNLSKLESLDLSQNKLFGEIPNQLTELTFLEVLDLSHNHLTGLIPRGNQFNNFENSSFQGNPGLCGDPMSKKCGNSETLPQPDDGDDSKFPSGYDWIFILAGYGSGLVVGLVIGNTLTKRKHHWFQETFGKRERKKQNQRTRRQRN